MDTVSDWALLCFERTYNFFLDCFLYIGIILIFNEIKIFMKLENFKIYFVLSRKNNSKY